MFDQYGGRASVPDTEKIVSMMQTCDLGLKVGSRSPKASIDTRGLRTPQNLIGLIYRSDFHFANRSKTVANRTDSFLLKFLKVAELAETSKIVLTKSRAQYDPRARARVKQTV